VGYRLAYTKHRRWRVLVIWYASSMALKLPSSYEKVPLLGGFMFWAKRNWRIGCMGTGFGGARKMQTSSSSSNIAMSGRIGLEQPFLRECLFIMASALVRPVRRT